MYEPSPPNRMLSEILVSPSVGGLHLQRVGEFLIARERMNAFLLVPGGSQLGSEEFLGIAERSLEVEEKCLEVWRKCKTKEREWVISVGLVELEKALREAASYFGSVASGG
jgi:hypothetical protein